MKLEQMITKLGFDQLSPIQQEVIKNFNDKRHLVGLAPTGTGKTHAYLLPILANIEFIKNEVQAVIIVPTNELVLQVEKMAKEIQTTAVIKSYYGSQDLQREVKWLVNKQPDIAILTPSKLSVLVKEQNALKIHTAKYFVLDEADMMFDESFLSLIDQTITNINVEKFLLFSASFTPQMDSFINKYFGAYLLLDTSKEHQLKIEHQLLKPTYDRSQTLANLLKHINPYLAIIFASKKETTLTIYNQLSDLGYNVCLFSSDQNVKQRKKLLEDIHNLKYQYVIASDLMARGIDFKATHIINYDLPYHLEFYLHRAGRTGRMNDSGVVITIQTLDDRRKISRLQNSGIDFQMYSLTDNGLKKIIKTKRPLSDDEKNQLKKVNTSKKIAPNYKKKHKAEVKKQLKKIKRSHYINGTKNR